MYINSIFIARMYVLFCLNIWRLEGASGWLSAGDAGLNPESGRSPRDWNGNPLQYFCLGNSTEEPGGYNPWGRRVGHD